MYLCVESSPLYLHPSVGSVFPIFYLRSKNLEKGPCVRYERQRTHGLPVPSSPSLGTLYSFNPMTRIEGPLTGEVKRVSKKTDTLTREIRLGDGRRPCEGIFRSNRRTRRSRSPRSDNSRTSTVTTSGGESRVSC